ncbi:MAG TPA: hypothetical protein VI895_01205 [Bdellovibrionota bacterium]|nr:hypothetical protein [Bdellovibrionota bacterium]
MNEDLRRLKARMDELSKRVRELEEKVGVSSSFFDSSSPSAGGTPKTASPLDRISSVGSIVALIGRTLIILGGAFFLRAMTSSGALPPMVGAVMGLSYAAVWIVFSNRAAKSGRMDSSLFYGISSAVIAFPLLWESTIKFGFFSPAASAGAVFVFASMSLAFAWIRKSQTLAWTFAIPAGPLLLGLAFGTARPVPFLILLLLLGLGTLWMAYTRDWPTLSAYTAGVANLGMLVFGFAFVARPDSEAVAGVGLLTFSVMETAFLAAYLGSFSIRLFNQNRAVHILEILQSLAALTIGLGGMLAAIRFRELPGAWLGVSCLLFAGASYAASFAFLERKAETRRNFFSYTTLALTLVIVSIVVLSRGADLVLALSFVALFAAGLGNWKGRGTLCVHGAVYLAAALLDSGWVATLVDAAMRREVTLEAWLNRPMLTAILASILMLVIAKPPRKREGLLANRLPGMAALFAVVFTINGLITSLATDVLSARSEGSLHVSALASVRTMTLAISALIVALVGRWKRNLQADWLAYTLLFLGGVKLVWEDFRVGFSTTLFASFAIYGAALILAPRILRRTSRTPGES